MLLAELGEKRDHELADLVPALGVRGAGFLQEELEGAVVIAALERGDDLRAIALLA